MTSKKKADLDLNDQEKSSTSKQGNELVDVMELPVLPLRDVVVYPHMVIPLFVGRDKSVQALEAAMKGSKQILLVAQKSASLESPKASDLYQVGTVSSILQLLKLPDGTVKVLVEGGLRGKILSTDDKGEYIKATVQMAASQQLESDEAEILIRTLVSQFEKYVKLNKKIPPEIVASVAGIEEPGRLCDTISAHIGIKIADKQKILEIFNIETRIEALLSAIESEIDLLGVELKIRTNVKKQMEKSQREYYLNEQIKAIQEELGQEPNEGDDLKTRIEEAGMPEEAKSKALSEFNKLRLMSPMSAEATVSRNYIDWMCNVPWKKKTKIKIDLKAAQQILDEDHYGLEKVKERIIEFLAVQKRVKKLKGPILCLVGPPGVGKTSLGKSIAKATSRKYIRMSLGGVRDEAEIRGHRRTYIGAMPGKILQKLAKVEVKNPLFLLDEIDKMAQDFRGDPASALLEVLDPEQNTTFNDHYLEVDYDLSDVMFVATANSLEIPPALLDRMEVIRLSGYTEDEKMAIAMRYLVKKQMENNGLGNDELDISSEAVLDIIRYYTREAGVRSLEREISKICRKAITRLLANEEVKKIRVDPQDLEELLGVRKYRYGVKEETNQIGQVTGLAWTEVGGEILTIEAMAVPGKGKTTYTGKLGDVMQESIQAALTVVRSRALALGIDEDFYEKKDIHVHVPEGATPKDGPSAGVGMCTALVSVLTGIPVRADVAMTGEITLRGEVLPIGGLKEKLLAAKRAGITDVIIPTENKRDLKEIPDNILSHLHIHCVQWIDQVLDIALSQKPKPKETKTQEKAEVVSKSLKSSVDVKNQDSRH